MKTYEIQKIVKLMQKYNLSEFDFETKEFLIQIKRGNQNNRKNFLSNTQILSTYNIPNSSPPPIAGNNSPNKDNHNEETINSPIVGTFFRSSKSNSSPNVKAGDKVDKNTIIGAIKAMGIINEIKSKKSGIIGKVLIEDMQPVEYGTPLFLLE